MEKQDGVPVALFEELFSGVFQEKDMSIVKGVPHLESVHDIGISLFDLLANLAGGQSVAIHIIVEFDLRNESHLLSRDEEVSLSHNSLHLRMLGAEGSKHSS